MDTAHGIEAVKNSNLYNSIVSHREKFNALRGLDFSNHIPSKISIAPPESVINDYKKDYEAMTNYMIYGEYLTFSIAIATAQVKIAKEYVLPTLSTGYYFK